jgi:hypothetical protein
MYQRCHVCNRSLGRNDVLPTMGVGRRLAFDPKRGRLWAVCSRCGEWNLTGFDERWEAVELCERLYAEANVRASTDHIGLARTSGLQLIRVGPAAHRDELANWRYGSRLRVRRRRASVLLSTAGIAAGGAIGGIVVLGARAGSLAVVTWGIGIASVWAYELLRGAQQHRGATFVGPTGARERLSGQDVEAIRLSRTSGAKGIRKITAIGGRPGREERYRDSALLRLLSAVLPRLNWRGATPAEIATATEMVDAEEAFAGDAERRGGKPMPAWQRLAVVNWPRDDLLVSMEPVARLAFEMAVTEELERRELAGEAEAVEGDWRAAEEVARIADSMFLPHFVTDWLDRHAAPRRGKSDHA